MPESVNFVELPPPDTSRWGNVVGCFSTSGVTIGLDPGKASDEARRIGVRRLSQTEVDDITTESLKARDALQGLLNFAERTVKRSWLDAAEAARKAKECNFFCGSETKALANRIDAGSARLREMGDKRVEAFKRVDKLMVYAQSPSSAYEMCRVKKETWEKYQEILNEISPLVSAVHQANEEILKRSQTIIEKILEILQALMQLIQSLITIIIESFKGIAATAGFLAKHPKLLWAVGGVAIIGILAFVLRPYFMAASLALGRR